jgi:hypothetical protein
MFKAIVESGRIGVATLGMAVSGLAGANVDKTGQNLDLPSAPWQDIGMAQGAGDAAYWIWLACGIVGIAAYLWISYRVIRWLLGHRRFRSSWYNAADYRRLLQDIREDQRRGVPLRDDELQVIRSWRGDEPVRGIGGKRPDRPTEPCDA